VESAPEREEAHKQAHKLVEEIQSIYISLENTKSLIDREALEVQIGTWLWEEQKEARIMRCKGSFYALNDAEEPYEYVLQGVEHIFELRAMEEVSDEFQEEDILHKFLFVGKGLDSQLLHQKLTQTLVHNRHHRAKKPKQKKEKKPKGPKFDSQIDVNLWMWYFEQCDPKKCSGINLKRQGLLRTLSVTQKFNGIVLTPSATKIISPADADIMKDLGVCVIDCSW